MKARPGWLFVIILLVKNIRSENVQSKINYKLLRTERDTPDADEDSDEPSSESDLFQVYPFHEDIPLKSGDFEDNDSFFNEDADDFFYDDLEAVESFLPRNQERNRYNERSIAFQGHLKNLQPLLALDRSQRHNQEQHYSPNDKIQFPQSLSRTKLHKRVTVDDIGIPVVPVKLKIIKQSPDLQNEGSPNLYTRDNSKNQPQYNDYFRIPGNIEGDNSASTSLMMKEVIAADARENNDFLSDKAHLDNKNGVNNESHEKLSSQNQRNYINYNQNSNLNVNVQGMEETAFTGERSSTPTVPNRFRGGVVRRGPKGRLGLRRKVLRDGARQRIAIANVFNNSSKRLTYPNRQRSQSHRYKSNLGGTPRINFQRKGNVIVQDSDVGTATEDNFSGAVIFPLRHEPITPKPHLMEKSNSGNARDFVSVEVKTEANIDTSPNVNFREMKAAAIFEKFDNYQIQRPNVQNFGEVRINEFISEPFKERDQLNTNNQENQQSSFHNQKLPNIQKQQQIYDYGQPLNTYRRSNTQLQEPEYKQIQSKALYPQHTDYGSQFPHQQKENDRNRNSGNHNLNRNVDEVQQERELQRRNPYFGENPVNQPPQSLYNRPNLNRYRQSRINHVRNLSMRNKNKNVPTVSENNNSSKNKITITDSNSKSDETVSSNERIIDLYKSSDNNQNSHLNSSTDVSVFINPIDSPDLEETAMLGQALTHALKKITTEVEAIDDSPKSSSTSPNPTKSITQSTDIDIVPGRYGENVNTINFSHSPSSTTEAHSLNRDISGIDPKNLINENKKVDMVSRQISKEIIPRIEDIRNRSPRLFNNVGRLNSMLNDQTDMNSEPQNNKNAEPNKVSSWDMQPFNHGGFKQNIQQNYQQIESHQNENINTPPKIQNNNAYRDSQNNSTITALRNRQYPQLYGEHLLSENNKDTKIMDDDIEIQKGVNIKSHMNFRDRNQKPSNTNVHNSPQDQKKELNNMEGQPDQFNIFGKYQTLPTFSPSPLHHEKGKHIQHNQEAFQQQYIGENQEIIEQQHNFRQPRLPNVQQHPSSQIFAPTGQEFQFRPNYQMEQIGFPQITEFVIPPEQVIDNLKPFPAPTYSNQHTGIFQFENVNNQIHPQHQFGIPSNNNKHPIQHINNEDNQRFDAYDNFKVAPFQNSNKPLSSTNSNIQIPFDNLPNSNGYLPSKGLLEQTLGLDEDRREVSHQRFRDFSPIDVEYNQKSSPDMMIQSKSETNQEFHQNSLKNTNITQNILNFQEPTNYGFNSISIHPSLGGITPFRNNPPPFLPETVDEPEMTPFVPTSLENNRGGRKLPEPISAPFQNLPEFEVVGLFEGHEPSPYFDIPIGPPLPRLMTIPETGFTCAGLIPGYYADTHEASMCQSFHFCGTDGRKISYLCPDGTMFNQQLVVCDHVGRVQCNTSDKYYHVNEESYGDHTPLYSRGGAFEDFGRRLYRY